MRHCTRGLACATVSLIFAAQAAAASTNMTTSTCSAESSATVAPLVELYTSEGCSSCPPADRWLSRLKADPAIVALAFHVDYWDRLGWSDRFASAEYSRRQMEQQAINGARFSYTPQVVVDGKDQPRWYSTPLPSSSGERAKAPVRVSLSGTGETFTATITPMDGAPSRLAAYWAVTEDGYTTEVRAGENRGESLHHDYVVREFKPVPEWRVSSGSSTTTTFNPGMPPTGSHRRHINFIVLDAITGKPLQAVRLGC